MPADDHPTLLDDDAVSAAEILRRGVDALGAEIARVAVTAPAGLPILVCGDWGAGKTSLLHAVRRHVQAARGSGVPTVWFDAWHHEGECGLLPALLRATWDQMPEAVRSAAATRSALDRALRCAAVIGVRIAGVAATAAGVPFLADAWKEIAVDKLSKDHAAVETGLGVTVPSLDPVSALRASHADLLARAWPGTGPVIVFVDDLDRCSPEGAVALIDAMRMLITGHGATRCRFVVALDRAVITQAICNKFAGVSSFDGGRYLEKLFPLEFHVPVPDAAETAVLLRHFLLLAKLPSTSAEILAEALSEPAFANPRLMKRCINRHILVKEAETRDESALRENGPAGSTQRARDQALIRWIAASDRWAGLRRAMTMYRDEFWQELAAHPKSASSGADPLMAQLVASPGCTAWLRREQILDKAETRALFRHADARLRRCGL